MDPILFGERVIQLLDEGKKSSTYKYALLLAIVDICLERNIENSNGVVTTRELAHKVTELYWPHARNCDFSEELGRDFGVLRQNNGGQAAILSQIGRFATEQERNTRGFKYFESRKARDFLALIDIVEETLVTMPIPRLQNIGGQEYRFIYTYNWNPKDNKRPQGFTAYQRGVKNAGFDNRLLLAQGAPLALRQLNGLLRPYIQRDWSRMIAKFNKLPSERLQKFLFEDGRAQVAKFKLPLLELQGFKCFYSGQSLTKTSAVDVDHFIPRSKYPNDGVFNLVAAASDVNRDKRDHLASERYLEAWIQRNTEKSVVLQEISAKKNWYANSSSSFLSAKSFYENVRKDTLLWQGKGKMLPANIDDLEVLLNSMKEHQDIGRV